MLRGAVETMSNEYDGVGSATLTALPQYAEMRQATTI